MTKRILQFFLCSLLAFVPVGSWANGLESETNVSSESTVENIRLTIKGNNLRVQQAQGKVLEIFSVTGAKVVGMRIDNSDQSVQLNLKRGCYIVRVGDVTRKISIL